MSRSLDRPAVENRLLMQLRPADYQRLLLFAEPISLRFNQVLCEAGEPIRHVWFPQSGVLSLITRMPDRRSIEVATVGREGMLGLPVFWGVPSSMPYRALVQVPGNALRIEAQRFQGEVNRFGPLHELLRRYTCAWVVQLAQSVACNGLHTVKQRCCRWLLMTHDRVAADRFPITQKFFAQMLGVRRASVAEVARDLQRHGLINYTRGMVTVLDRHRLEAAACPCYRVVNDEYQRLLGM